jgi:ribose transport system substrate-binding protein
VSGKQQSMARTEPASRRSDREYIIPILAKSLQILHLLRDSTGGLRVDEISTRTGIARSTVYRIVRTFMQNKYVDRNAMGHYRCL